MTNQTTLLPEVKCLSQSREASPYLSPAYLDERRWAGYFLQLELVRKCKVDKVLEIGYTAGIFAALARQINLKYESFDNDPEVRADKHGDIRELSKYYPAGFYEGVVAFEVLEHLPWEEVEIALKAMATVTSRWAIISVPYAGVSFGLGFNFDFRGCHHHRGCVRIPAFWQRPRDLAPEFGHRWEAGLRGFSLRRIRSTLTKAFKITRECFHPLDKSQVFWVLEKK